LHVGSNTLLLRQLGRRRRGEEKQSLFVLVGPL
jgi:hypothetical protein